VPGDAGPAAIEDAHIEENGATICQATEIRPRVRIPFPPAKSLRTIGSSLAEGLNLNKEMGKERRLS